MPGFPQGKVPIEVSSFHNKLEKLNTKLQGYKGNVVEILIGEDSKSPQDFIHFKNSVGEHSHVNKNNLPDVNSNDSQKHLSLT